MASPRDRQHEMFDLLLESQFWPPARLAAYQRAQLGPLLHHARNYVPFYEHRLDAIFTPSGGIDWRRWTDIPIVTRADMETHRDALLAKAIPRDHGDISTIESSGSSGRPIRITANRLTVLGANTARWRAQLWHSIDWSATYTARHGFAPKSEWPAGLPSGPWGPRWDERALRGQSYQLSRNAAPDQILEFLGRTGSRVFSTGPKTLHSLALEAERTGLDLKLDWVMSHGEHAGENDKAAVARVFGAKFFEHYSSKEGGQMAPPCPVGPGLHVNAELLLLEIVGADGKPVPVGTPGRVVITPFLNTAQPLIRYDQGDIATLGPPCACGRCLPVLSSVSGRATAIFTHPDGRTVSRMLSHPGREMLKCTFWQVAQVGPLAFEVRYVPRDWDVPGDEAAADALWRSIFFEDAELRFVRVRDIPLTPGGKYLEYRNEWAMQR